jgi:ubiquitin conjugation factor E4 B
LRFVNLLLNDATFVLDEALTKFPKIHDLQEELARLPSTLTEEERNTKQDELAAAENSARTYMQLTNETISMMKLFSESLSASFTMPEIVDRVAAMVDYTLDTIVGPKSANLKVEDPRKYQFHARSLLSEFIDIYLNLSVQDSFIDAVARDGRSYKPANFEAAIRIITRHSLKSSEDIKKFSALKERFRISKELEDQADDDLGEIPDEYLDPIMATLMLDPVILPTSRQTVDRSTIRSHLLSDPTDLFNRQPLKIEDVIDNVELREEVMKWRDEKRAEAKKRRMAAVEGGAMDTSQ